MEKDLLLKRLLTQAGVSVLAGLLMSSAVLAEDVTADAGDTPDASISIDMGDQGEGDQGDGDQGGDDLGAGDLGGGDPDVSVDPNDPGLDGGDIGGEGTGGTVDDGSAGDGGEQETRDDSAPDTSIDFGTEVDTPVDGTFETTGMPQSDFDLDPGAPAQSGSGDIGQTPEGNGGESQSHLRREVK